MLDQEPTDTDHEGSGTVFRLVAFAVVGLVAVGALLLGARYAAGLVGGTSWDVVAGQDVEVTIDAGSSANSIYIQLEQAGVVRSSELRAAVRGAGAESQLRPGVYEFVTRMEPDEVLRVLLLGGSPIVEERFTVVEGWTIDRILTELGDQTRFSKEEYAAALSSGTVTSPLTPPVSDIVTPITRWEGLLFPARYDLYASSTPSTILQQMADEMVTRLGPVDWSRIDDLDISRYEAIIIGSLIQREAGIDEDRPLISSVIHNRLRDGIRLQIDATVVYAVGGVDGRVTGEDLKVDSPYNTYRVDGLPPTPIGTVQIISIDAAVNPEETPYYFYVLSSEDGAHAFAETYEEHLANIKASKEAGVLP